MRALPEVARCDLESPIRESIGGCFSAIRLAILTYRFIFPGNPITSRACLFTSSKYRDFRR